MTSFNKNENEEERPKGFDDTETLREKNVPGCTFKSEKVEKNSECDHVNELKENSSWNGIDKYKYAIFYSTDSHIAMIGGNTVSGVCLSLSELGERETQIVRDMLGIEALGFTVVSNHQSSIVSSRKQPPKARFFNHL